MKWILSLAIFCPMFAFAEGKIITLPLKEEKVIKDQKDCFYTAEINLGTVPNTKPFQIFRQIDSEAFEEVKYGYRLIPTANGELILKITSSASAKATEACPTKEALLLN